jgi:hypothetical protein
MALGALQDRELSLPSLTAAVEPLLKAREAVERQIADLDRKVLRLARNNAEVRRFMTAPGVGPITALCFLATIDDPSRFKRSRSVGAYAGLTTRRYASGETEAGPIGLAHRPQHAGRHPLGHRQFGSQVESTFAIPGKLNAAVDMSA